MFWFTVHRPWLVTLVSTAHDWALDEPQQALSVVHRGHAESYLTSAVLFPVAARTALHRQDVAGARALLSEAQRLRPLLSHAIPWVAVESLLQILQRIGYAETQVAFTEFAKRGA